jgi:hypothetical protein
VTGRHAMTSPLAYIGTATPSAIVAYVDARIAAALVEVDEQIKRQSNPARVVWRYKKVIGLNTPQRVPVRVKRGAHRAH